MQATLIDLIRHGEPVGGQMIRGNGCDHALSPLGWTQMRQALGDNGPWDQIVSSPMARCREFALALAQRHGLPLAVEPALREIGMGAWEGRRRSELARLDAARYQAFVRDPLKHRPPGGEGLLALQARVAAVYERHAALWPGRHLLFVCHAGVSRALIGHVLQAPPKRWYRIRIDYAGISRIRHGYPTPNIECVNAPRLPAPD
ncbi:alpha-ribazole phosphatase family protein [Thiohalocapsa marina]|uniref:Alpha-ribazole phosphatase family protein n=1 Tax=Thiohalocapsa marina TaxID=424902 RepID=A0A5M8FI42_9GAMM|nr:alpha-ribazole phosphatase family protein [Thiohalocapsa marina]KAA6184114.1 alpha-ribazole phosphatase family protein [Thiohalocapsa marina]